jgi:hypothetical protein
MAKPTPDAGLAVVDLSTKKLASVRGGDLKSALSVAKVGVAVAAFRLREAVRDFAHQSSATTPSALISEITSAWKPIIGKIPSNSKSSGFPNLARVLSFTPPNLTLHGLGWDIDFITTPKLLPFTKAETASGPVFCRPELGFIERTQLMIHHSNNEAASLCIEDLSYQYIRGALEAEGFALKGVLGFWIGGNYPPRNQIVDFPPVAGSPVSATPDALAMLLVALDTNSLISPDASADIVKMMKGSGSFMSEAFKAAKISTTVDFAKDGLGAGGVLSEIDVCTKSDGTRYGAVIMQIPASAFDKAAVGVDGCF